ncbi:metal-dependent hydrolase [Halonotius aquaticus]|uniref:Metal-dependent hydrolase n=1 Tax=Halonotius aquaticus TaxID=2216978 RepID=A0A3A6Q9P2_9EURY|nr:metal-dependent hydrolase [Halonotius aquaticus]RJX42564.1 metal-dependent hydrolase [Halonotius aquaticus]
MLFPTHLVVAAGIGIVSRLRAAVSGSSTGAASQPPLSIGWLVIGAALPDVVDKPLGIAGVTELFHSVGHSALVLPVMVAVALASRQGLALAIGWGSHLFLDALHVVINGRPSDALFFGWPVVSPPNPPAIPPGEFFWYYLGSLSFYLEVLLWLAVGGLVVWSLRQGQRHTDLSR